MNFWQTIAGDKFLNVSIPNLINEIDSLTDELKKLNQEIESKVVSTNEIQLASTINKYCSEGWQLKHYIPEHIELATEQIVDTVLVFERKAKLK
jgi:hypothetical protein